MLSSFLNSIIQLFKGTENYAALETEDDSQATRCEKHNSYRALDCDQISPGSISNDCVITNNTTLSDDVVTVYNAIDNAEIHTRGFQNDTKLTNTANIDVNSNTKDGGHSSPMSVSYKYRTRALTVDESLMESAQSVGQETVILRHRDPTFFSERLEKCVSLPNLFRTTSIQDKSMKITRKRRQKKHDRLIKNRSKYSSSESENESNEITKDAIADDRRAELEFDSNMNGTSNDKCDGRIDLNAYIAKSFDSLMDELKDDGSSSDSDEYCSCNEELIDDIDNTYSKKNKPKKLGRISSIQKRSWSIRQRRRENFYKRRSMDIATNYKQT